MIDLHLQNRYSKSYPHYKALKLRCFEPNNEELISLNYDKLNPVFVEEILMSTTKTYDENFNQEFIDDLVISFESTYLENYRTAIKETKKAALIIVYILNQLNINYSIKTTGFTGYDIAIPHTKKRKSENMMQLHRNILKIIQEIINTKVNNVEIDKKVYRKVVLAPYSLNSKTGNASIPLYHNELKSFDYSKTNLNHAYNKIRNKQTWGLFWHKWGLIAKKSNLEHIFEELKEYCIENFN